MSYSIYKNCSYEDFFNEKRLFEKIKTKLLVTYSSVFEFHGNANDADVLGLNFFLKDDRVFVGNVFVGYEDKPGHITYNVTILKTYDLNGYRYFKKEIIIEGIDISYIQTNLEKMLESVISIYNDWNISMILKSSKTEIER